MDFSKIAYVLTILQAGYLTQLSFRQPSSKVISTKTESWLMWIAASPLLMIMARAITIVSALYQALIGLLIPHALPNSLGGRILMVEGGTLQTVCPTPEYLDGKLFTWSGQVVSSLILLYLGSYIRLEAYRQLGSDFTYRIAKPDQLVTTGFYAYVRHPSYTGLLLVLLSMYSLFLRPQGIISCWAPLTDAGQKMATNGLLGIVVPVVVFPVTGLLFMVKRVGEEEEMMEQEFGEKYREWRKRTKKFVPFVY